MTYNRITAEIGESRRITTRPVSYQYDTVQILMLTAAEGVELPEFYQVDFCVIGDEDTVTMVGSLTGGAPIPDGLLRQGENLMAFLVLTGTESDVQTRYEITIPVNERPTRSGIELSDDQQAQVDSLIAALNEGVDRAEDAADAIENMGAEAETLPEGSEASVTKTVDPETGVVTLTFGIPKGAHGDPGYSPTIEIATITGGHRITVTDSQGSASFDVMDGEQGDPGAPGDDGYSPAVTITQITNGHRVTITDKTHQSGQTFDVMDGEQGDPGTPGDDGYSPAVTITTITGGHRVTITDKTHPSGQSFDVMDGASDAGQVSYDPTQTYQSGTVGKELSDQSNAIDLLEDTVEVQGVSGTVNFNNYITAGKIYVGSSELATATNAPPVTSSFCLLAVEVSPSGVVMQTAIYSQLGFVYSRRRGLAQTWSNWVSITEHVISVVTGSINFNNYVSPDKIYIGSLDISTATNSPTNDTTSFCILSVESATNDVITQIALFPLTGMQYIRRRRANGTWSDWIGDAYFLEVLFANPVISKVAFKAKKARVGNQDIAVYNGNIFDFDSGYVSVNGGSKFAITNGHGNNAMFGNTLHGSYPYLYCGSWDQNDCKVYVNQVTNSSATLVRTIQFDTLSGYLNMCVDEDNNKIYILLCTSATTSDGDVDFIVASLSDGSIISRKTLDFKIPIIQGMQFAAGLIYVTYGNVNSNVDNIIMALTTDGDISCKSCAVNVTEIEGIAIDSGKIYIADNASIYY